MLLGLTKPCAEMFPAEQLLLQEALALGIPLTLGSDVYDPAKLGKRLAGGPKYALAYRLSRAGGIRWS